MMNQEVTLVFQDFSRRGGREANFLLRQGDPPRIKEVRLWRMELPIAIRKQLRRGLQVRATELNSLDPDGIGTATGLYLPDEQELYPLCLPDDPNFDEPHPFRHASGDWCRCERHRHHPFHWTEGQE